MFSIKKFVKKTLMDAIVEANALGWYEKGVLGEDDLAEIEEAIEAKNTPEAEEPEEEPEQ